MGSKKKTTNGAAATAFPKLGAEDFVKAWQAAESSAEAAATIGPGAPSRAARYRKAGVKLKVFEGGRKAIDSKALNALIKNA